MKTTRHGRSLEKAKLPALAIVDGWEDLGAVIKVRPRIMAWALKNRDRLQKKIKLGERTVYQSGRSLKYVQMKLIPLMEEMQRMEDHAHVISYRAGVNPVDVLRSECCGHKYEVHFDLKKYYDHITYAHLVEMFQHYGASYACAKLLARYSVVTRKLPGNKQISTLQQGSPVSPIISNLVGAYFFDRTILAYLEKKKEENPKLEYVYKRYSDNIFLFLDGEIPMEFLREYRQFVWALLPSRGFYSHKWAFIPHNHPKRNQKALGVVLNSTARAENVMYERIRAILFNACVQGIRKARDEYFEKYPLLVELPKWGREQFLTERFFMSITGKVAYLGSINAHHKLELTKLLKAAKYLHSEGTIQLYQLDFSDGTQTLHPALFAAVKMYRRREEDVDAYLARMAAAVQELKATASSDPRVLAA